LLFCDAEFLALCFTDFRTSKIQRCKRVDHNRRDNNSVPNVDLRKSGLCLQPAR
jgi:hypothetical protein